MKIIKKLRYRIARRVLQLGLLFLFVGGNYFGWTILRGNYSAGKIFNLIPLADPYAVLQMVFSGMVVASDLLLGALLVLLIYGLFTGRMFCTWVCPMNIVADTAMVTHTKLNLKARLNISRRNRYVILILGLILSPILGYAAFEAISPIAMLHREIIFGFAGGLTIVLGIALFDIAVLKFGWCGHLCPLGAIYSLIGKFSIIKIKHSKESCTLCNKCFDVCHEEQVLNIIGKKTDFIHSSECTNCARCIEICDDKALRFSLRTPMYHLKK